MSESYKLFLRALLERLDKEQLIDLVLFALEMPEKRGQNDGK